MYGTMIIPPQAVILYGSRPFEDLVRNGTVSAIIRPGRWRYDVGRRLILASSFLNWAIFATATSVTTKTLDEITEAEAVAAGRSTVEQVRLDIRYVWSSPEFDLSDLVTVVEWELE
jgi:hypothetical protein